MYDDIDNSVEELIEYSVECAAIPFLDLRRWGHAGHRPYATKIVNVAHVTSHAFDAKLTKVFSSKKTGNQHRFIPLCDECSGNIHSKMYNIHNYHLAYKK